MPLARLLSRLPPSTPRQISAIFKIVVGLVQCLSTLRSFSRVLWPEVFADFIAAIDQFAVEVSSLSKRSHIHRRLTRVLDTTHPSPSLLLAHCGSRYMTAMPTGTTAALTMALIKALTMAPTMVLTMALTMALTTAGLLHRACRVHHRSAARLLLRARRHAPPARALLLRGQPHRAPTLALSLC